MICRRRVHADGKMYVPPPAPRELHSSPQGTRRVSDSFLARSIGNRSIYLQTSCKRGTGFTGGRCVEKIEKCVRRSAAAVAASCAADPSPSLSAGNEVYSSTVKHSCSSTRLILSLRVSRETVICLLHAGEKSFWFDPNSERSHPRPCHLPVSSSRVTAT